MVRHQTGIDVVLIYLDLNCVSTWFTTPEFYRTYEFLFTDRRGLEG